MTNPTNRDPLMRRLESDLHEPVRPEIWRHLAKRGWLELARGDPQRYYEGLRKEYEALDESFPQRGPRRGPHERSREVGSNLRLDGVSRLLTGRAARDPRTLAFRQEVLGGSLLPWRELDTWARQHAAKSDETALVIYEQRVAMARTQADSLIFARPEQAVAQLGELAGVLEGQSWRLLGRRGYERATLHYITPEGGGEALVPVSGPLFDLYRLVVHLTEAAPFPWLAASGTAWAATWAVCGEIPPIPRLRTTMSLRWPAILSQVTIEANWRVTAEEVKREYNWARGPQPGRDKDMDERHIALALLADRWRHEAGTWPARREEWNALCDGSVQPKKWRFPVRNDPYAKSFSNQARAAWRRLTAEKWAGG